MKMYFLLFSTLLLLSTQPALSQSTEKGLLFVANQSEHTALLIDLSTRKTLSISGVDINGHEVAVSPDGRFGYVPIYGNSGVGKPGTDGSTIHVVDLLTGRVVSVIDLGKPVRPHAAHFGPDGLLYVTAELANSVYSVDVKTGKIVAQTPTGQAESHMLAISPDGTRGYTANVGPGSISVLDLKKHTLVTVIPVAKTIQRLSLSPDGKWLYTHDQKAPRIAVIDTSRNAIARWITVPSTVYSSQPTPDGKLLIADSPSGQLFVIDLSNDSLRQSLTIPPSVGEVFISPDGAHAYVSCPQGGTIEILDLRTLKMDEPIRLTKGVDGLQWFPAVP